MPVEKDPWILRCPGCGASLDLSILPLHEDFRRALLHAFELCEPLGEAMPGYLGLFRARRKDGTVGFLTPGRAADLIGEILTDIRSGRCLHHGVERQVPREAWAWGMRRTLEIRNEGDLRLPLKNHRFLHSIVSRYRPDRIDRAAPGNADPQRRASRMKSAVHTLQSMKETEDDD